MNNIFEGAYFGKPYKTRDGRKALYHCFDGQYHRLITSERCDFSPYCNDSGKHLNHSEEETPFDIVSEWIEEIDEEELEKLAVEYADHAEMTGTLPDGYNTNCWDYLDIVEAFKAGRLS